MIVPLPTPNSAATTSTVCPSCPTRGTPSGGPRSVNAQRARICSCVSDQVCFAHRGSWQRHTRLTHTCVTGRPAAGRSPDPRRTPEVQAPRTRRTALAHPSTFHRLLRVAVLLGYNPPNVANLITVAGGGPTVQGEHG
jgi:hypothetical protein